MFDKLIDICRKTIPNSGDVHDSYTTSTSRLGYGDVKDSYTTSKSRLGYGDLYTPRNMNSARR